MTNLNDDEDSATIRRVLDTLMMSDAEAALMKEAFPMADTHEERMAQMRWMQAMIKYETISEGRKPTPAEALRIRRALRGVNLPASEPSYVVPMAFAAAVLSVVIIGFWLVL